ncbi:LINE-1 retrotransposable element ORF2 protein [Eumeta japonica]|uniref:LINE-1 retrotransposable element ORF2 protein n=1 Tax=Eumeta variegata TaxID=151549 RepID=A0A4C1UJ49_EUMVA|nr:LINE-1 retrotransposable element ORF2 protein [Eumeta japonica]
MRRLREGIEDYGRFILHYKGETPGLYGVGFLIKKELMHNLVEIKGISERISVLNIKLPLYQEKDTTWSIIQAYSPTESNKKQDIEKIENFYSDLQATIQNSYKNIILMGDFNGQVGVSNPGEEFTIGRHGYGKRTKNGERLVSFAMENKLRILNTFYNRKSSRKWTWISPNGLYKNEVDFIMSNNSKVIKNLSVIDQLNFNSDHRMVRATLTSAHVKKNRRFQNKANNLPCLGDNDKPLRNLRTSADSTEQNTTIQEKYNNFLNLIRTETTRINKEDKTKVLSCESKQLLEQRKEIIRRGKECIESRQKIRSLSKQINVSIRRDRKVRRQNTLQRHIERTGGLKKAIKELEDKRNWLPYLKNIHNDSTSKRQEILKIATDYYKDLYKSKAGKIERNVDFEAWPDPEPVPPILKEELIKAINSQKLDKAPGSDRVSNELLKSAAPAIAPILTNIFNEILMSGCIPTDWMKSTIVLLHKKGEKGDINNYRPISLMSNIYKVFSKIILSRIAVTLDENQPKEQAGFRSKFSTIDHIHVLRQVLQKYQEYNKTYYIGFVDFQKAFDSLEHEYIWEALRCQGVQMKYIRTLSTIYSGSTAQVKLEATGEPFSIQRGVRQGDPISPKLFSAVLEMIFRNLQWECMGLNINGEKLNHLRFADDLILFSENSKSLEKMLQQLSDESEKAGLKMNLSKTKIMTNAEPTDLDTDICWEEKEKWTRLITEWYPRGNKRSKGRQHKRWEDDIKQIAGAKWTRIARDRETWKSLEEAFVAGQAVTSNNPIADVIICKLPERLVRAIDEGKEILCRDEERSMEYGSGALSSAAPPRSLASLSIAKANSIRLSTTF